MKTQTEMKSECLTSDLIDRLRWLNNNAHTARQVQEIQIIETELKKRSWR